MKLTLTDYALMAAIVVLGALVVVGDLGDEVNLKLVAAQALAWGVLVIRLLIAEFRRDRSSADPPAVDEVAPVARPGPAAPDYATRPDRP